MNDSASNVRVYADLPQDVDQSMKEVCVKLRITRKRFLEQSIVLGIADAKAEIASEKVKSAKSKKG